MSEVELQDAILRHALELQRLSAHEEAEAEAILRELERELRQLLASDALNSRDRKAIARLIAEADKVIEGRYASIAGALDTHGLTLLVADRTVETLSLIGPGIVRPTAETLASLARNILIEGAPSSAWWEKQGEDTAFKFAAAVRQGVINGETNERIVARVVGKIGEPGILDMARRNVRALVHSSIMTAANDARLATYRKNARFVKGVRWLATLDPRSCPVCMAMDGQGWNLEGEKLAGTKVDFRSPPAHWNCFPASTRVATRGVISGATKRVFDGEVVVINTASGRNLTATPNHPILTNKGWVAIGMLDKGDNVVCERRSEWVVDPDVDGQNVPASIHDVAEAFLGPSDMFAVPMEFAAEDFHGDAANGKVGVVWADGLLSDVGKVSLFEQPSELVFIDGSAGRLTDLPSEGGLALPLETGGLAPLELTSPLGHASALLGCCPRHANALLFAPIAEGDSLILESGDDGASRNADLLSDSEDANPFTIELDRLAKIEGDARAAARSLEDASPAQASGDELGSNAELFGDLHVRFPGQVFLDEIISVDRQAFHGDVFNLETSGGWYVAEGIVTHNCRCVLSPIPKSEADTGPTIGARASKDGPLPASTSFNDFLKRQSPAFVARVLGKERAALFAQGRITVRDLVSGTGRELTLAELRR